MLTMAAASGMARGDVAPRAGIVVTSVSRLADGRRGGFWACEGAYPWRVLRSAGWDVEFISSRGGPVSAGAVDRSDLVQRAFLRDRIAQDRLRDTTPSVTVRSSEFSLVVFAGGSGALEELELRAADS